MILLVNNIFPEEIYEYSQEIKNSQEILIDLGIYTGDLDGVKGLQTENAIKEFQRRAGLVVDGVLGPNTKLALEKGEDSYVTSNNITNQKCISRR